VLGRRAYSAVLPHLDLARQLDADGATAHDDDAGRRRYRGLRLEVGGLVVQVVGEGA